MGKGKKLEKGRLTRLREQGPVDRHAEVGLLRGITPWSRSEGARQGYVKLRYPTD